MLKNHLISLIAAYTKNGRVIGSGGKIPWSLKSERNRFKKICNNKKIIMGRKSFEEIGHALPYCTIIILSHTLKDAPQGCILARTLEEAIDKVDETDKADKADNSNEIIIAGGGELYRQTIPFADKIYATEIDIDFDSDFAGDTFFPSLDQSGSTGKKWQCLEEESHCEKDLISRKEICYKYLTYTRIV